MCVFFTCFLQAEIIALIQKICTFFPSEEREYVSDNCVVRLLLGRRACYHRDETTFTCNVQRILLCVYLSGLVTMEILVGLLPWRPCCDNLVNCRVSIHVRVCKQNCCSLSFQCDKFIKEYGEKIIQYLVLGYGPKVICTLIGVCLEESKAEVTFSFNLSSDKVDDCSICEFVLGLVKDIVGENFTKVCWFVCCCCCCCCLFVVVVRLLLFICCCCLFDVHV